MAATETRDATSPCALRRGIPSSSITASLTSRTRRGERRAESSIDGHQRSKRARTRHDRCRGVRFDRASHGVLTSLARRLRGLGGASRSALSSSFGRLPDVGGGLVADHSGARLRRLPHLRVRCVLSVGNMFCCKAVAGFPYIMPAGLRRGSPGTESGLLLVACLGGYLHLAVHPAGRCRIGCTTRCAIVVPGL